MFEYDEHSFWSLIKYNPVNLHVQVEDHDTPPEELHYLVISKPSNGYLTLGERPEPVTSFTQYDVNHGRLHFTQQVKSQSADRDITAPVLFGKCVCIRDVHLKPLCPSFLHDYCVRI